MSEVVIDLAYATAYLSIALPSLWFLAWRPALRGTSPE